VTGLARAASLLIAAVLAVAACGDDTSVPSPAALETTAPVPVPEAAAPGSAWEADVAALADDAMEGRAHLTPGSEMAQAHLVEQLSGFAQPLGDDYHHPFEQGTNILALIPGTDLAREHLILGAHYDHLGRDCPTEVPGEDVCNGASDNAAGVAAVLEIGRRLAAGEPPRRSVVLAFWDAEEVGLLGSRAYVGDPLVPLESTVAYLNWDILGANLLPSLSDVTVVVGAETGGPPLVRAVQEATGGGDLEHLVLSLLFGQGRSDHAPFAAARVPVVFFTDATNACYHTAQDDMSTIDLGKLGAQIDTGEALTRSLAATDEPPAFDGTNPPATHDDARQMLDVVSRAVSDADRFPEAGQELVTRLQAELRTMVDAGPDAFDDEDLGRLVGASAAIIDLLTQGECAVRP
jgi:Zn-dependent M28 family amino/carboxypeptidase